MTASCGHQNSWVMCSTWSTSVTLLIGRLGEDAITGYEFTHLLCGGHLVVGTLTGKSCTKIMKYTSQFIMHILSQLCWITFYSGTLMAVMNATPIITLIMPIHTMLDETGGTMIQEDVDMTTISTDEMDFTGYAGLFLNRSQTESMQSCSINYLQTQQ